MNKKELLSDESVKNIVIGFAIIIALIITKDASCLWGILFMLF